MNPFALLAAALLLYLLPLCAAATVHNVADYLPTGYDRDGSVAYHAEIQQALHFLSFQPIPPHHQTTYDKFGLHAVEDR